MTTSNDDERRPVVSDDDFMVNVCEALENGYDIVCAYCGTGMSGDDMEMHERECPQFREWR